MQLNFSLPEKIFTVSEFIDYLNEFLKPQIVTVKGEIGNKPNNYPNYSFFNLLDDKGAVLKCFALLGVIEKLGLPIKEGMEVKITGYPEIWKKRGEIKFRVLMINFLGEGLLKKQFEVLKRKLSEEGYFDEEKKKKIPLFPKKIGLITSKYGKGAKKDFLTHLNNFGFRVYFFDSRVEGTYASAEISRAISWFNENMPEVEVIVITRGGGDWESLQSFNSEELVKAIFASKIPIISGIGHEDDETLVDFVADLRASTPTAAAKILSQNWIIAREKIGEYSGAMEASFINFIESEKEKLKRFNLNISSLMEKNVYLKKSKMEEFTRNLKLFIQKYYDNFKRIEEEFFRNSEKISNIVSLKNGKNRELENLLLNNRKLWQRRIGLKINYLKEKLEAGNPELKLKQGYSIALNQRGKVIKNLEDVNLSEEIKTKLYKGQITSKVKKIKEEK